jgi:Transglutaminase-like superfamily
MQKGKCPQGTAQSVHDIVAAMAETGIPVFYTRSRNIDEHVARIISLIRKSVLDPELRQLALKIVSGSYEWKTNPRTGKSEPYVKAWGKFFSVSVLDVCPPRDDECELIRIWDFVIKNFRYVYDPVMIDTFASAKVSLEGGGGDCDDAAILIDALLSAIGFHTRVRVISVPPDKKNWVHIYPMVGLPKDNPTEWIPLDCTVRGYKPGDEWPTIAQAKDYEI